jgi:uncharacterized protein
MIARFADTSFYVALGNPKDSLHEKACQLAKDFHGAIVTTDFVVVEVGNFLSASGDRKSFETLLKVFRSDPRTETVPATRDWLDRGVSLYLARPDKNWSHRLHLIHSDGRAWNQ